LTLSGSDGVELTMRVKVEVERLRFSDVEEPGHQEGEPQGEPLVLETHPFVKLG